MMNFFKRHYVKFIFPVFIVVGLIRAQQIHLGQAGHPTMKGSFTFFVYIIVGIWLMSAGAVIRFVSLRQMSRPLKTALCVLIGLLGIAVAVYFCAKVQLY